MSYLKIETQKTYWAIIKKTAKPNDKLIHFIKRNEKNNTSKAHIKEVPDSKLASLDYTIFEFTCVRNKYRKTPSNQGTTSRDRLPNKRRLKVWF
jgi:hypothetical protein